MDVERVPGVLFPALCVMVFVVTFLIGDVVGLIIEIRRKRRWRDAASKLGMSFSGGRKTQAFASEILVPLVLSPGTQESVFSYGESRNILEGPANGFSLKICDFAVWDFHTRGPLAFRGVVCIMERMGMDLRGEVCLVKSSSILLHGLRLDDTFREFHFVTEREFARLFALFSRGVFAPWVVTPALRSFLLQHHREIDFLFVRGDEAVLLWTDTDPERFVSLLKLTGGLAELLWEHPPRSHRGRD